MMLGFLRKEYTVLPAEPVEFTAIAELHSLSFARGWSASEIEKLALQSTTTILVAHIVGKKRKSPVGFNIIRTTADEAEILSVAAHPDHRRSGIGALLMRDAIRRLQGNRVEALFLEVDQANDPAVTLYSKLGFEEVGARPGYYQANETGNPTGRSAALVMRLGLS